MRAALAGALLLGTASAAWAWLPASAGVYAGFALAPGQSPTVADPAALINDATGDTLINDATGNVMDNQ